MKTDKMEKMKAELNNEKKLVEKELSLLYEMTLRLENELYSLN